MPATTVFVPALQATESTGAFLAKQDLILAPVEVKTNFLGYETEYFHAIT